MTGARPNRWPGRAGGILLAGLAIAAAGCGSSLGAQGPSSPRASPPMAVGRTSSSPGPAPAVSPYPNLSRFTDPIERLSYRLGYSDCRTSGLRGIARSFGGDPARPETVATAYANTTYGVSSRDRQAAWRGCLDAFSAEEAGPGRG